MANVVLPKVRMFIPCLGIEPAQGPVHTIRSTLHTIRMPTGLAENYLIDEIWFLALLTDGVGTFRLSVDLYGEMGFVVTKSKVQTMTFHGGAQLTVREVRFRIGSVPFAFPGLFEFRLVANHAHVEEGGTAILRVLAG